MKTTNPIDRRSLLKGSVLGGAATLFSLVPDAGLASAPHAGGQNTAPAAGGPESGAKTLGVIEQIKLEYVFQIRIDFSERVSFATPNGRRSSDPVPVPTARGKAPSSAAMVVIMMGRKRSRQA